MAAVGVCASDLVLLQGTGQAELYLFLVGRLQALLGVVM
jgi:hypothetical protein